MAITAAMVKELREMTGAGMMDCKKALVEADGDVEKAILLLREKGLATQAKKSSRVAAEGIVMALTNDDHTVGAVVEVNVETDFAAGNEEFKQFCKSLNICTLFSSHKALKITVICLLVSSICSPHIDDFLYYIT